MRPFHPVVSEAFHHSGTQIDKPGERGLLLIPENQCLKEQNILHFFRD